MAFQKKWTSVPIQNLTADATAEGRITLASTVGLHTEQEVTLKATGESAIRLKVSEVQSETVLTAIQTNGSSIDLSAYTVAKNATLEGHDSPRPSIPDKEYERAVYAEAPIVAKRLIEVDRMGRYFSSANPKPALMEFTRNGAAQEVTEDTVDPSNNRPLPVKLSGFTGDVAISAENLNLDVQTQGDYDAIDNPKPDSTGIIAHERSTSTDQTKQTERPTAKRGSTNTDTVALDVSLHDHQGNEFTDANPLKTSDLATRTVIQNESDATQTLLQSEFDQTQQVIQDEEQTTRDLLQFEFDQTQTIVENEFDATQTLLQNEFDQTQQVIQDEEQTTRDLLQLEFDQTQTAIQAVGTEINSGQYTMNEAFDKASAIGGQLDDVSPVAATEGNVAPVRITPQRGMHANLRDSAGNEITSRKYGNERGLAVQIGDGGQRDSFDRLRVSSVQSVFNVIHTTGPQDLFFENVLSGAGSVTHVPSLAAMQFSVGTASGDSAIRQTKRYVQYNAGRSYLITISGNFGAAKANVRKRWGYFNDLNGFFFEQNGTGLSLVLRSNTSGSPVDTSVAQANFNIDKVDGTGTSGLNLQVNTHHLYIIDYVWQGAGRVRFGVVSGGKIVYFHEFVNDNVISAPYTRNPSLPIRVELTNTGTSASSTTANLTCISVNKESTDKTVPSYVFSVNRGVSNVSVAPNNTRPLISIRPKLTFNGIANRVSVRPTEAPVISISNPLLVELVLNPTLTGPSWVSADANSATEYDISATASTGGTVIKTFYVGGLSGQSAVTSLVEIADILFLSLNIAGSASDILMIRVTNLGSGNTSVNGALVFEEYQ